MRDPFKEYGPWLGDACAILQDIGGGGLRDMNIKRKNSGQKPLDVRTFAAPNGIYYSIYNILHIGPVPYREGHPIYDFLKKRLGEDQYSEVIRMRDMTRLELEGFSALSALKTQRLSPPEDVPDELEDAAT
jgi:hypothetical protein